MTLRVFTALWFGVLVLLLIRGGINGYAYRRALRQAGELPERPRDALEAILEGQLFAQVGRELSVISRPHADAHLEALRQRALKFLLSWIVAMFGPVILGIIATLIYLLVHGPAV
jgi:hypothetical protein